MIVIDSGVLKTKLCIWTKPGSGNCTIVDNSGFGTIETISHEITGMLVQSVFGDEKYHKSCSLNHGENMSTLSKSLAPDSEISE